MIDYIFYFALTIVMAIACVAFGIAVGCKIGKKEETRTEDFFQKRAAYRAREMALKKELQAERDRANELQKEVIVLRDDNAELSLEVGNLRYKMRRLDSAKERANHD